MAKSRKKQNRRVDRGNALISAGRASRRLRAELMESRLMLSASTPQLEMSWPTFSGETGVQYAIVAEQTVLAPLRLEGGFLSLGSTLDATFRSYYDADDASAGGSTTINDLLNSGSDADSFDFGSPTDSTELFSSGELFPREVDPISAQSGPAAVPQPELRLGVSSSEGGLISLRAILAPHVPNEQVESPEMIVARGLSSTSWENEADESDATTDNDSLAGISGEWARAAIFEVAGGEPADVALNAQDAQGNLAPAAKRTFGKAASESEKVTSAGPDTNATEIPADGPHTHHARGTKTIIEAGASTIELGDEVEFTMADSGDLPVVLNAALPINERTMRAGTMNGPTSSLDDEALAAVFEEIGKSELPGAAVDQFRLNSFWGSTPLLAMFALEHLAARKSRRRRASAPPLAPKPAGNSRG